MRHLLAVSALAVVAALAPDRPLVAAPHVPLASDAELDRQTVHVLERLVEGDVERATVLAGALARRYPRFALGQLLHAELSAVAALDGTRVGSDAPWSPALLDLLLEARARLDAPPPSRASPAAVASRLAPPAPFVQIGNGIEHIVHVDLERSTLTLYAVAGGIATPVREHYVSSGSAGFGKWREGDRKTPLGLYRITRRLSDPELPELYGAGALVLDYPNAIDRYLGRTGSGIWLHGVPRARTSRGPRSSEGCVTMSNQHLVALGGRLDPARTLVVLSASRDRSPTAAGGGEAAARYRALFHDWRDERVRDTSTMAWLADIDANDVTILETTASGLPGVPDLLAMDIRPDTGDAAGVTLWWTRPAGTKGWTLALEDDGSGDT